MASSSWPLRASRMPIPATRRLGQPGSGNGSNGGNQAGKPAGDKAQGSKKNGSAIPNTGDQTAATVATVGGLGAIIAAIGAFFHRRSKAK